ncbi:MAG: bifunctional (p)ppGpp synthetase/guanosine-3',5'-bis(diphosphate) 3'-pyrophosphohydrolase [Bacteroidales bacterium]|nr:bifunctional (p)ppGpp synthetase/guanosine-3',5'-bis(diphosphate) 3'-pyrophosphohydrolase [Bacteroidales bacterium]
MSDALVNKEYQEFLEVAAARCRSEEELATVQKAFDFACEAHRDSALGSGEPYILHPLRVAMIAVSSVGLGYKSMCAALLHDIPEHTDYSVEDLRPLFGDKIAQLVEGLAQMRNILDSSPAPLSPEGSEEDQQAENFKRILLTMGDDVRVVLIKLADRLDNCRHLDAYPQVKADKVLAEVKGIFIPLSHRLGLYAVKSEMENIWLKYKQPESYHEIESRIDRDVAQRSRDIDEFIEPITSALEAMGLRFEIKKRIKTPYSIWHKMRTKHVSFEQIYDLYAVRIIFESDDRNPAAERKTAIDIYTTITAMYADKPNRLRNWIRQPKPNGYEALHCTVMSKAGIWVEVQIRSRRMDDIAEKGIAAHWAYKQDGYLSENDSQVDRWLEKVQEIITSGDIQSLDLLDMIQDEIATKAIVVFTPKGEQRDIPKDSTALDFAYSVHTDIGNQAIAAKVNMKLAPLSRKLRNGDQVEIITARRSAPKPEWLSFLQTRHARRRVLDYLRTAGEDQLRRGEEILRNREGASGQEIPIRISLFGNNRPGLMEEIEIALRQIDGIEDVVTCEI